MSSTVETAAAIGPFADESSRSFRASWDRRASLGNHAAKAADRDPADRPRPDLYDLDGPDALDLAAEGISTVIWATGFGASTGWLPPAALDRGWRPQLPDLHVLGAPGLTHRSSANLYGIAADAERLANALADIDFRAAA